jgi:hypothetical protein
MYRDSLEGCDLSQPFNLKGAVKPAPTKAASSRRTPKELTRI